MLTEAVVLPEMVVPEAVSQSIVSPAPGVAVSVTLPVPHRVPPVVAGAAGRLFTVIVVVPEVALEQPDPAFTTTRKRVVSVSIPGV